MKNFPSASFDIVICDPPYNIGKDFGNNRDNLPLDDYIEWMESVFHECRRLLKNSGTMFIYGFPETLARLSVSFEFGKYRFLEWHYTNKTVPSLNFWQRSHESILCVWKEKPFFNRENVREPYTENFIKNCKGKSRAAGEGRFGNRETVYNVHEKGALPRDVIHIPALAGGAGLAERIIFCKDCGRLVHSGERKDHLTHNMIIHPTQKPMALTERLIVSCIPQGVFHALIPFCGSGSECGTVLKLKGRFTSFEINSDYIMLAQKFLDLHSH